MKKRFFRDYDRTDKIFCIMLVFGGGMVGAMTGILIQLILSPEIIYIRYVILTIIIGCIITGIGYHQKVLSEDVGNEQYK